MASLNNPFFITQRGRWNARFHSFYQVKKNLLEYAKLEPTDAELQDYCKLYPEDGEKFEKCRREAQVTSKYLNHVLDSTLGCTFVLSIVLLGKY